MGSKAKAPNARRRSALASAVAAEMRAEKAIARLTIEDLAALTSLSRQTLMHALNDTRTMDLSQFSLLSEAMGLDPVVVLQRAQTRLRAAAP